MNRFIDAAIVTVGLFAGGLMASWCLSGCGASLDEAAQVGLDMSAGVIIQANTVVKDPTAAAVRRAEGVTDQAELERILRPWIEISDHLSRSIDFTATGYEALVAGDFKRAAGLLPCILQELEALVDSITKAEVELPTGVASTVIRLKEIVEDAGLQCIL